MPIWKQTILVFAALAAALLLWVTQVPAALPFLDRYGVLAQLDRLGLHVASPAAEPAGMPPPGGPRQGGGPALVVAEEPAPRIMNDIVTAIGSARAARAVTLASEISGRLTTLNVASGDYVEAGATVAELDSDAARIAVDRATLMLDDARATWDRLSQLQTSGATTQLQVQEADLALKTAELALREAEFALAQHRVVAPVSGWVGILAVEIGDQVSPNVEITRIEDRSSLIVDFRVPERIVRLLKVGDPVTVSPLAQPGVELAGRISALDNRVDEASRTLLVQAAIGNEDDRLRPGMAFKIALAFTGESHPAVDPLAIQWGSEGAYVWAVREGKAKRLPIRILQRNSDVVLVELDLMPGDLIVTQGVQSLRPGSEVAVVEPGGKTAPAAPKT